MITVEETKEIHKLIIKLFGGSAGIRDEQALESALLRPYQTYEGKHLHKDAPSKAAAIIQSIVINHPFFDGNKRMGYILMRLTLGEYGFDINVDQEEAYRFVIKVAEGKFEIEDISSWIAKRLVKNVL